jgi:hypothetical protein
MSELSIDIERVVREVLAEMRLAQAESGQRKADGNGQGPKAASPVSRPASPAPLPASVPGELAIRARVVTMTEVAGRLDGIRRLVVSHGAIITPAVRDELIRRGIALACDEASNGRPATTVRVVLVTVGTDIDPKALVAGLTREGTTVEHVALDCLLVATEQLAAETAHADTLGILLTPHTAAGLCLANRLRGLRAVTGGDAPAVAAAAAAVGANLLVVDPQAGTFFQVKQMVAEFCRGGVRPCPAVFRARLV